MPTIISGDGTITGLTATGISAVQQLPAGSVIQVVNATNSTVYSTTSTSFVASGMSASITPKFATSKILVLGTIGVGQGAATTNAGGGIALYRGTTSLQSPNNYQFYTGSGVTMSPRYLAPITYLDSPATTSTITYNIYFASYAGTNAWQLNEGSNGSTITLLEIAQ